MEFLRLLRPLKNDVTAPVGPAGVAQYTLRDVAVGCRCTGRLCPVFEKRVCEWRRGAALRPGNMGRAPDHLVEGTVSAGDDMHSDNVGVLKAGSGAT